MPAGGIDEAAQKSRVAQPGQGTLALVGRVEHGAGKAGIGQRRQPGQLDGLIGEQHGDQSHPARDHRPQTGEDGWPVATREQAEFDIVDAGRGHGLDGRDDEFRLHGQIADGGADGRRAVQGVDDFADDEGWQGAQGPLPGIFQIDDVGAAIGNQAGLGQIGDAGEHPRHDGASPA